MLRTEFISTGFYVPEQVITNDMLTQWMDTSDEWIRQRTGIEERHWVRDGGQLTTDLALEATKVALDRASLKPSDIDCIIFATLSPEYFFPGGGVYLQHKLGLKGIPALDVRNQCSGFLYGLSVADAWVRTGTYKRVLLVGAECQSPGIELNTHGRDYGVIFADGAGVAILGPTEDQHRGVLTNNLYADGAYAGMLFCDLGGCAHKPRITPEHLEQGLQWPVMHGREVFKHATTRMPEAVNAALEQVGATKDEIKVLITHQANLRISEMVQRQLELRDDQVYNNIQKYGNTTAASIPIALDECVQSGKIQRGDLVMMAAFGAGFTWASSAVRW